MDALRTLTEFTEQGLLRSLEPQELLEVAKEAEQYEKAAKALKIYERAVSLGISNEDIQRRMANCFQKLGRTKEARERWLSLAEDYASNNDVEGGMTALQQAVDLEPSDLDLRQRLVDLLVESGDKAKAASQLQELINLRIALRMNLDVDPGRLNPVLKLIPGSLTKSFIAKKSFDAFSRDIQMDFPIWERKTYFDPAALAPGDGPIGKYRRWARQFYSQLETVQ